MMTSNAMLATAESTNRMLPVKPFRKKNDAALDISAQLRQLGWDIQSLNPFLFNHLLIEFIQGTDHARQISQQFSDLAYEIQ